MPQHNELTKLPLRLPQTLPKTDADWTRFLSELHKHFNCVAGLNIRSGLTGFNDSENAGYFLGWYEGSPVFVVGDRSAEKYLEYATGVFRLGSATTVAYGDTPVSLAFGVQSGEASDGEAVTFDPEFATIPRVIFGQGGLTHSATLGAVDQCVRVQPQNLTTTGFTLSAKITDVGSLVARSDAFTETTPGVEYLATKALAAEAYDDNYTVNFSVAVEASPDGIRESSVSVHIYSRPAAGTFSIRWSGTFNNALSVAKIYSKSQAITVDGLDASAEIKIVRSSVSGDGGTISANSVDYSEASVTEVSMTPSGASKIPWVAIATS